MHTGQRKVASGSVALGSATRSKTLLMCPLLVNVLATRSSGCLTMDPRSRSISTGTQPPMGLSDEGIAPQLLELDASQASALLLKKSRLLSIVRPTIAGADAGERHRLFLHPSNPVLHGVLSGATFLLEDIGVGVA